MLEVCVVGQQMSVALQMYDQLPRKVVWDSRKSKVGKTFPVRRFHTLPTASFGRSKHDNGPTCVTRTHEGWCRRARRSTRQCLASIVRDSVKERYVPVRSPDLFCLILPGRAGHPPSAYRCTHGRDLLPHRHQEVRRCLLRTAGYGWGSHTPRPRSPPVP